MVVVIAITTQLLKLKRAQPVCPWLAVLLRLLFSPATLLVNRLTSIITTIMAGYLYQMAPDLACSLGRNKATNWTLFGCTVCHIFWPKMYRAGTLTWHWTTFISWRWGHLHIFKTGNLWKSQRTCASIFHFLFLKKKMAGFIRSAGKKLIYQLSGFKTIAAIFLTWCHLYG